MSQSDRYRGLIFPEPDTKKQHEQNKMPQSDRYRGFWSEKKVVDIIDLPKDNDAEFKLKWRKIETPMKIDQNITTDEKSQYSEILQTDLKTRIDHENKSELLEAQDNISELLEAQENISELLEARENISKKDQEIEGLRNNNTKLEHEKNFALENFKQETIRVNELQKKVDELEKKKSAQQLEIEEKSNRVKDFEKEKKNWEVKYEGCVDRIEELVLQNSALEKKINEYQTKTSKDELDSQISNWEVDINKDLKKELESFDYKAKVLDLAKYCKTLEKSKKDLEEENNDLKNIQKIKQTCLEELVKENSVLKKSNKDLEIQLTDVKSGFDEKLNNYENKVANLEEVNKILEDISAKYWMAETKLEEEVKKVKNLKTELNEFKAKCICRNGYVFEDNQLIKMEVKGENVNITQELPTEMNSSSLINSD